MNDGGDAAAGRIASLALLASLCAGALLVLSFVLVAVIVPSAFPLVLVAVAALTRLEGARLARVHARPS